MSEFQAFGKVRLFIDRKNIYLRYELFGIKLQMRKAYLRENIIKLEYTNYFIQERKNSEGEISYEKLSPQIIIWAGNKAYTLNGMTHTEIEWLIQELSDYLELPFEGREIPIIKSK